MAKPPFIKKESEHRINEKIRVTEVRLVGENGKLSKARLPKSQVEWFKAEKERQETLKQKMKDVA